MKLLRLEMKGFKSFARETSLHFNEKITGIVGPNGSGKSNVVDAIRWVLGEQKSSHLRLEKMGDILFNGTKKRKPAPVARVTVTFENDKGLINSEYSELSVTRILYGSGDSEYRINDVVCRLKDIKSVLMDTGIGSNSYAIIALGMVDDILSDKDQARRKMFEQAAGISKYKTRKRETLNKLKLTTADLDRVEDLIHELNLTLKQQKKQARKAEKYLKLKEQYKSHSIDLAILNSTQARKDFGRLKDQLSQAQAEFDQLNASIRKQEAEIESKKQSILEKESSVSQNQRGMSNIVREIQSLENKRDITRQSITYNTNSSQRLEKQIEQKKEKITEFAENTEKLRKKIEGEESTLEQQRKRLTELKIEKEISQKSYSEIKSGRSQRIEKLQDIQQNIYDCKQNIAVLESRIEGGENQIQRIEKQISIQADKEQTIGTRRQDEKRELDSLTSQLNQLLKSESDRTQQLAALKEKKEEEKSQAQDLERKYDALQNEHELLKGLVEKLEGFPESTKFLMRSKKWDIRAALFSDVLISSGEYRAALENYLERYLSHFIVDQPQDAVKGIQLLKDSQNGKANFIVNSGGKRDVAANPPSGAIPAVDVVETDAAYEGLISHLLQDVFIVKDESVAFELSQKHAKYTFLVQDGTAIFSRNSLSGGSSGLFEGKRLGRKKNLKKVNQKLQSYAEKLKFQHKSIQELELDLQKLESNQQEVEINRLKSKKNQLNASLQNLQIQEENIQESIHQFKEQIQELSKKRTQAKNEIDQVTETLGKLKKQKQKLEEKVEEVDSKYEQKAQRFSELSQKFNEAQIKLIQQENLCSQLKKDQDFQKSRESEIRNQIQEHQSEIDTLKKELEKNQQTEREVEHRLADLYKQKENKSKELNTAEQSYFEDRNVISDLEKKLKTANHNQRQKQDHIQSLKEQKSKAQLLLHGISERLKVEFDISINQIIEKEPKFSGTPSELESTIIKIKEKLQRFGDVNPMAVEAFKETKARYDLMLDQKNDILEAQDKLHKTIREIENTATKQFMEAFETIRTNFIDVFQTLFTDGDNADLILSQPENPLESEVEIVAKPKGKRPKSLSQLSGGEKTLTATALLFSLYLLKPAPFCVFDEVDAPLDDANIEKFNRIIKRFAEQSQFIIVTHNKSTMAAVDVIYGVYMNEPGVSGLSPVDFRELEHKSVLENINTN